MPKALEELHWRMSNATVRIAQMWPFPAIESPSHEMMSAFEGLAIDHLPPEIAGLISSWPEDERGGLFCEEVDAFEYLGSAGWEAGRRGWLAIAETPVFTFDGPDRASYSWGHYYTSMLFSNSAEGLLEKACEWAEAKYETGKAGGAR